MGFSRTRFIRRHSTASAVATHSGSSVTGRSRTCPLVMHHSAATLVRTKLHHRHQQNMTRISLRPLHSTRLHRSLHISRHSERSVSLKALAIRHSTSQKSTSKLWRADTLHPETPVPTTATPQLRWRAGVLSALRPFRRLRGKQQNLPN